MKTCICKINVGGDRGTGFFAKMLINYKYVPVFITNNHIINQNYLDTKIDIKVNIYDNPKTIKIKDKVIYTNEEYDITIIEVNKEKEDIKDYLEFDENIFNEDNIDEYLGNSIYLLQYPTYGNNQKLAVSYGIIKERDEYNFKHYCSTEYSSSGSPILNIYNNKIIGIHKQRNEQKNHNIGLFLYIALKGFIFEYKCKYFYYRKIDNDSYKNQINNKNNINNKNDKRKIIPCSKRISPPNIQKVILRNIQPNNRIKTPPNIRKVNHPNNKKEEVQTNISKANQLNDKKEEVQINIRKVNQSNNKKEEIQPIISNVNQANNNKEEVQANISNVN